MLKSIENLTSAIDCMETQGCSILRKAEIGQDICFVQWQGSKGARAIHLPENRIHHSVAIVFNYRPTLSSNLDTENLKKIGRVNSYRSDCEYEWWCGNRMDFTSFYFRPKVLNNRIIESFDVEPSCIEFRDSCGENNLPLINLFQQIVSPLNWNDHIDIMALSQASDLMLYLIIKEYIPKLDISVGKSEGLTFIVKRRIEEFIHENLDEQLTVNKLAAVANLSSFHFLRMFKMCFGETPARYLMLKRLERAQNMLNQSPAKIVDIALACGFSSQSHFTFSFKKQFGMAPNNYRKQKY